jgi:hypothetical protein
MIKSPSINMHLYLFEGVLFKESILSGQIRESEAIIKLLNFFANGSWNPDTYYMSEWVSEWLLLFNANSAIFQLYHGENKLIFNEMMMRSALY